MKRTLTTIIIIMMLSITAYAVEDNTMSANLYISTDHGFELIDQTADISVIENKDTILYSLTDLVEVTNTDETIDTKISEKYFRGSYDNRSYDVISIFITIGDNEIEYPCYTEYNDEIYVDSEFIVDYITDAVITSNSINILTAVEEYPKFIQNTADEYQNRFLQATFLMYVTFDEGYNVIMNNTKKIKVVSANEIARSTGYSGCTASALYNYTAILWDKGQIDDLPIWDIAALLVHESKHFERYHTGDRGETETVLIQGKAMYTLTQVGYYDLTDAIYNLTDNLSSINKIYNKGIDKLNSWIDAQEKEKV